MSTHAPHASHGLPANSPSVSRQTRTLIISSGDVAGLLAIAAIEQSLGLAQIAVGDAAMVFPGPMPEDQVDRRLRALREQAACFGLPIAERSLTLTGMLGFTPGELESLILLDAQAYARRANFDEVVWAIHASQRSISTSARDSGSLQSNATPSASPPPLAHDTDRASQTITRSLLVERLAALDAGPHPVQLRAPYADLTDRQLADLMIDMDLPVWTCWWWGATNDQPHAHQELTRWTTLLRDTGWGGAGRPTPAEAAVT